MQKLFFVFTAVVVLVACTPKVVEVIEEVEETTDTVETTAEMSADAAKGAEIYSSKCTQCHGAKIIDNYSKERWDQVLPNMINKAKLDENDAAKVTAYVEWELNN